MSNSKIFKPNFVCVLTNERYKTYQTGFLFCPLGHAPGVGLWGQGVKQFFFKHGHVANQIDGNFVAVVFVALHPMSTAMVIAGRSVHLTTLFPGQA